MAALIVVLCLAITCGVVVAVLFYMLPSIIAHDRRVERRTLILVLNVLLCWGLCAACVALGAAAASSWALAPAGGLWVALILWAILAESGAPNLRRQANRQYR